MRPHPNALFSATAAAALLLAATSAAQAQAYPAEPIRLIVPFPAAGGTDVAARLMATKISASQPGWNFVIDNRPGAGGNIGLDAVAKAKPDGYTLGMGQTANLAINPALYPGMPYKALSDFVPIAIVAAQPVVLVVRAESPFKTLADLVAAIKAKPGTLSEASAGNGTVGHLAGELLRKQAGIDFIHVPYRGAGPAATDLLGGQVHFYFATPPAVIPFLKSGKLRALVVTAAQRLPVLPDVPTTAEAGYKGVTVFDWKMLVAPAGTPLPLIKQLNAEVEKAMSRPDALANLLAEGGTPMHGSAADAAAWLKAEHTRWGAVVRDAGIKLE